eukprot:COSAG05_NODE_768_length_7455_cov_4.609027_3_plen_77_part_00
MGRFIFWLVPLHHRRFGIRPKLAIDYRQTARHAPAIVAPPNRSHATASYKQSCKHAGRDILLTAAEGFEYLGIYYV